MNFAQITVWQCAGCKRILKTQKGIEQHKATCKRIAPPCDGQISIDDVLEGESEKKEIEGG